LHSYFGVDLDRSVHELSLCRWGRLYSAELLG
jgi:hypothetical protein